MWSYWQIKWITFVLGVFNKINIFFIQVSSEDSEDSDFQESGVSEEVSESEDEQRPRTR